MTEYACLSESWSFTGLFMLINEIFMIMEIAFTFSGVIDMM